MEEKKQINRLGKDLSNFSEYKKQMSELYHTDDHLRSRLELRKQVSNIETMTPETLKNKYYNNSEVNNIRVLSREAYKFYANYAGLIDYLANSYTFQYIFTLKKIKENKSDYKENYNLASSVTDGISVSTVFPLLLTTLLVDGVVFIVTDRHTPSKTVITSTLPSRYCKIIGQTQYGTSLFKFDYNYFDDLNLNAEQTKEVVESFPKIIQDGYRLFENNKQENRWMIIDGKYGCALSMNSNGFPTKLSSLFNIKRYQKFQENEILRSKKTLENLISHEIPSFQGEPIATIPEIKVLHESMKKSIDSEYTKLITSFGKVTNHSIGGNESKENKILANARNTIYDSFGINPGLMIGDNQYSLLYSLVRDSSTIWKYIQQLVVFYNIAINNLYNFKGFQAEITMLPITWYNREKMIENYKSQATLGVGKLEFIVSSGVKQTAIKDKLEVEEYLKLDELKPLTTSYTRSEKAENKTSKVEEDDDDNDDYDDDIVEEKNNDITEE